MYCFDSRFARGSVPTSDYSGTLLLCHSSHLALNGTAHNKIEKRGFRLLLFAFRNFVAHTSVPVATSAR